MIWCGVPLQPNRPFQQTNNTTGQVNGHGTGLQMSDQEGHLESTSWDLIAPLEPLFADSQWMLAECSNNQITAGLFHWHTQQAYHHPLRDGRVSGGQRGATKTRALVLPCHRRPNSENFNMFGTLLLSYLYMYIYCANQESPTFASVGPNDRDYDM